MSLKASLGCNMRLSQKSQCPGVAAHAFNSSTQGDFCKFKAGLVFVAGSRPAMDAQ